MGKRAFQRKAARALNKIPAREKGGIQKVASVHRGRKKREQARQRVEKKRTFIETEIKKLELLQKGRREEQRKKQMKKSIGEALSILPNLVDALPSINEPRTEQKRNKLSSQLKHNQWRSVLEEEKIQMGKVQNHQAFKDMGIHALKQHLSNTVIPSQKHARKSVTLNNHKRQTSGSSKSAKCNDAVQVKAAQRREQKKQMAEKALQLNSEKRSQVRKQTLRGLLGGNNRGRIGEKRPKQL